MADKPAEKKAPVSERRRFLRESLNSSVPLLLGLLGGRKLTRLVEEPSTKPEFSPPPEAAEEAPAEAKEELDEHMEEFLQDNPDADDLLSP